MGISPWAFCSLELVGLWNLTDLELKADAGLSGSAGKPGLASGQSSIASC
jgi:hypothetical protein